VTGVRYDVVDVFTDQPYAGNPLAVVHGGERLSRAQMQSVAAEFGLSETAFPLPPTAAGTADYRVRIFTPVAELPFAGHPSIGTAWVLARDGVIARGDRVQECGAGLLPVRISADGARIAGGAPEVGNVVDAAAAAASQRSDPAQRRGRVAQPMQVGTAGRASSRSREMGRPQRSQVPYRPSAIRRSARSSASRSAVAPASSARSSARW
jgi:trans-2,3-dihydro-3-hydroxyanthranilate isomerase